MTSFAQPLLLALLGGFLGLTLSSCATSPVTVTNTPLPVTVTGPVSTKDVDNPARHAVQVTTDVNVFSPNLSATVNSFVNVPSGKRLVIEYVSGRCFLGTLNQQLIVEVGSTLGAGPEARYTLAETRQETLNVLGGPVRIYADPGTAVNLYFSRDTGAGDASCRVSLSGHLVDVP